MTRRSQFIMSLTTDPPNGGDYILVECLHCRSYVYDEPADNVDRITLTITDEQREEIERECRRHVCFTQYPIEDGGVTDSDSAPTRKEASIPEMPLATKS